MLGIGWRISDLFIYFIIFISLSYWYFVIAYYSLCPMSIYCFYKNKYLSNSLIFMNLKVNLPSSPLALKLQNKSIKHYSNSHRNVSQFACKFIGYWPFYNRSFAVTIMYISIQVLF
jgi:hypothetical protein